MEKSLLAIGLSLHANSSFASTKLQTINEIPKEYFIYSTLILALLLLVLLTIWVYLNSRGRLDFSNGKKDQSASENYSRDVPSAESHLDVNEEKWMDNFDQFVLDHLDDSRFGIEFTASAMGMSRRNLHRKIKSFTGKSPKEYVHALRMEKAKEYLESKKFSTVKQTAASIGIKNSGYFSELYRERFGMSPAEIIN